MNTEFLRAMEWIFILYAFSLTGCYLILILNSVYSMARLQTIEEDEEASRDFNPDTDSITIISPAYNEEDSIIASTESLLALDYENHEVIIVNDGSRDHTLERLKTAFQLYPSEEASFDHVRATPASACYRSPRHNNLRVIDKENGGKADALNVGINYSLHPIICGVDADSLLDKDSLTRIVRPFLKDADTIAVGGMVRVMNGAHLDHGSIRSKGLPKNIFALFQVIEYTRSFLYGRLGWLPLKAIFLISGAFGVFKKESLIQIGGYRRETIGEDMELVVRMHRIMSEQRRPYRIEFVADAICWTECPEDAGSLRNQRIRWQRGLGESLKNNMSLLCSKNGGAAAWVAFPFLLIFELFGPAIEVLGITLILIAFFMGSMNAAIACSFLVLVLGLSMAVSAIALLIDEFHNNHRRPFGEVVGLFMAILFETLIYRQIINYWRTLGLLQWMAGTPATWGTIKRRGLNPAPTHS